MAQIVGHRKDTRQCVAKAPLPLQAQQYATELNESGVRIVDTDHSGSAFISFPASNFFCASEQS